MTDFTLPSGELVHLVGDPHMGKRFETGVPVHRRGEQETRQLVKFVEELEYECDILVVVGDLFDNPYVPHSVIVTTAMALIQSAERNPNRKYEIMAGNHDVPRNLNMVGAWTSFARMVDNRLPNVRTHRHPFLTEEKLLLMPWEWGISTDLQLDAVADGDPVVAVVGHWDLKSFGEDDSHLAPTKRIHELWGDIPLYSGHYHTPGVYTVQGIEVICTGSMMPYSHGEDPNNQFYVTVTREEALERTDLHDKFVRVILQPGEDKPLIECLALTTLVKDKAPKSTVFNPSMDWNSILKGAIKDLHPVVKSFIEERAIYDGDEQRTDSD